MEEKEKNGWRQRRGERREEREGRKIHDLVLLPVPNSRQFTVLPPSLCDSWRSYLAMELLQASHGSHKT